MNEGLFTAYYDLVGEGRCLGSRCIYCLGSIAIRGAEDGFYVTRRKAVCKVLFKKLIGCRNGDGTQLMQT